MKSDWYHQNSGDVIWWQDDFDTVGDYVFSFDMMHTFNFFADYPDKLTEEQRAIFRKENPELASLKEEI